MITLHLTRAQLQDLYTSTLYAFKHSTDADDMEKWNELSNILFEAIDAYDKKHDD